MLRYKSSLMLCRKSPFTKHYLSHHTFTMGYDNWVVFNISNKTDRLLSIKSATQDWGKYYYPRELSFITSNRVLCRFPF